MSVRLSFSHVLQSFIINMKIVLACDHAGFLLKQELLQYISSIGHTVIDAGTFSDLPVDYPVIGQKAARMVANGDADRAVLVCGTGFGISLAANSVQDIRCVNCTESYTARLSRQHNDSNAIAFGARVIGVEAAKYITDIWLNTEFDGGRHAFRVNMLTEMKNTP